jgi:predicted nucleic acid-binding protein
MNRILIDTNVVISFLTDRNLRQQEQAARLFEDASAGRQELVLHQMVVTEVVYVLRNLYKRTVEETAATIRDLTGLPGIVVLDKMPWPDLFDLWPLEIASYADAALVAVARSYRHDYLATFDQGLRNRLKAPGVRPYPFAH